MLFFSLFIETKNSTYSAVKASSAYKDIVQGINSARDAALLALEASELAAKTANGDSFDNKISMLQASKSSQINSNIHLEKAKNQYSKVKGT